MSNIFHIPLLLLIASILPSHSFSYRYHPFPIPFRSSAVGGALRAVMNGMGMG